MAVMRIFVEKAPGFDIEAKGVLSDLRDNLGMTGIKGLRLLNRYDVSGLTDAQYEQAKTTVFSEPNVDIVYDEVFPIDPDVRVFATEYLPGQYDQRADSAAQCAQLLTQGERPDVLTAKVYVLSGDITEEEFARVKSYIINPVESREASLYKPRTLEQKFDIPADVQVLEGFTSWDDDKMAEYFASMGFAMTLDDLKFCRDYFRDDEQRDPTVTELKVIDTYWSDHCRHTTFLTELDDVKVEEGGYEAEIRKGIRRYLAARAEVYGEEISRPVTLMDMGTIGAKVLKKRGLIPDLDESEEINACSIEVPVEIDITDNSRIFHHIRGLLQGCPGYDISGRNENEGTTELSLLCQHEMPVFSMP